MANHRKHNTRWFTTSDMRAINLDLVTDVRITKRDGKITSAIIYIVAADRNGQGAIDIGAADVFKLLDLLI